MSMYLYRGMGDLKLDFKGHLGKASGKFRGSRPWPNIVGLYTSCWSCKCQTCSVSISNQISCFTPAIQPSILAHPVELCFWVKCTSLHRQSRYFHCETLPNALLGMLEFPYPIRTWTQGKPFLENSSFHLVGYQSTVVKALRDSSRRSKLLALGFEEATFSENNDTCWRAIMANFTAEQSKVSCFGSAVLLVIVSLHKFCSKVTRAS